MSFICSFRNKNEEGPRGSVYQFRPAAGVSSRCVELIRKCLLLACVNMRKRSAETMCVVIPSTPAAVVPHTDSLDGPQAKGGLGCSFGLGGTPRLTTGSSGFQLFAAADSRRSAPRAHPRPEAPVCENVIGSWASGAVTPATRRRRRRMCSLRASLQRCAHWKTRAALPRACWSLRCSNSLDSAWRSSAAVCSLWLSSLGFWREVGRRRRRRRRRNKV